MANVSIARRYARALLDVSSDPAAGATQADAVAEQLGGLVRAFTGHKDLTDVMLNPAFPRSARARVVEAVIKSGGPGLSPVVGNLLRLLVDRNRLSQLPDIARVYRDLADARAGRLRGELVTAAPLGKDVVQRLEQSLEKATQRDVVLEPRVDPSVIGGVAAQVGGTLYDGTLRTQLEELRRTLKAR
jgi:F-type H+-transporting ATPase subunit delta